MAGVLCLAAGSFAVESVAAESGLIEAFTATSVSGDVFPFRYLPSAIAGGTTGSRSTHAIDRTNPGTWAPELVYQLERYAKDMTVTFTNLVPQATYTVELHLTENWFGGDSGGTGEGRRVWKVLVNGETKETGIDIYKEAGGAWKALVKPYSCLADANGQIAVRMVATTDNAHFSGIALFGTASPAKPVLVGSRVAGSADLKFEWAAVADTLRYYLQRSTESAEGPWSTVGDPLVSETTTATHAYAADPTSSAWYRLVASNGVAAVSSDVVSFEAAAVTDTLKTTGSTVADAAAATYGISIVGDDADGPNTLAADEVTAAGYLLEADGDSTLALGEGQTFTVGALGVGAVARTLTVQGAGTLAAKDGILGLSVKDENAKLLVTAPVSGGGKGQIVKRGAGTATFAGPLTGITTYVVGEGAFIYSTDEDVDGEAAVVAGAGDFVKAGTGVLTLTGTSPDFAGDAIVRAGTLRFGRSGSVFGNSAGRLVVEAGGALDVATPAVSENGVKLGARTVVVSGAGPDGKGAIVSGGLCQYNAFANGELAGDVVFGGGGDTLSSTIGRWDFRNGAFNLNGHSIRKIGKNMVCFTGVNLSGDTGVEINVEEGYWSSETSTSYAGGSQNAFNISSGAYLDLYNMAQPITWTVNFADGAFLKGRNGSSKQNHITGPVILAPGRANLRSMGGVYATLDGVVSGAGGINGVCESAGRVTLANPANTYTGGTTVQGGDLAAVYRGSLPGYDDPEKLVITNATLILTFQDGADGTWGSDDVRGLVSRGHLKSSSSRIGLEVADAAETRQFTGDLTMPLGALSKYGDGAIAFDGAITWQDGGYEHYAGSATFSGPVYASSTFSARIGRVSLLDGAVLTTKVKTAIAIGTVSGDLTRLVVSNATVVTDTEIPYNQSSEGLYVGKNDCARAILEVCDGAMISNKYVVGHQVRAQGAIHQRGGRVVNCGGAANDICIGVYGYGYLELTGGYHEWMGYGQVCSQGASANGVFVQHGGTFEFNQNHNGRMAINRSAGGGHGEIYQDGGTFHLAGKMIMGEMDNYRGGVSWWTIDGAASAVVDSLIDMADRTNHVAILNLNGGVLETQYITARAEKTADLDTAKAFVNFNGGTLRSRVDGELFRGAAGHLPDAVTIYAGGATFDTAGRVSSVQVPLVKPSGSGLASITAPDLADYIGSPVFTITGDGEGATAHAVYDARTMKVTGVKITSPGTGYTYATVTSKDGGWTNVVACTATLAANATTGGLTKTGAGSLTLTAANTFGGAVRVLEGTLAVTRSDAFPEGNELVLDGGCFDGGGATVTAGVVRVVSGTLKNVTLVCDSFEKTGEGGLNLFDAEICSKSGIVIEAGPVLVRAIPGLLEGQLAGVKNWEDANPGTAVRLNCAQAEVASNSDYGANITWVYTGYIWNRTGGTAAWTLGANFDDYVRVWIDGELVLDQTSCWDGAKATVSLSPGPHRFEARFSNGTRLGGRVTGDGVKQWDEKPPAFGFAIDFEGRDAFTAANFAVPVDPGDGSLFTLAQSTRMALNDLTSGAVDVQGDLAVTGAWTLDATQLLADEGLTVSGALDLSGVTELVLRNGEALAKKSVVLARATGGITVDPADLLARTTGLPKGNWTIVVSGSDLRLNYVNGTTVILR
ncbi:MAG: autotransporter-associated beta strand repeat-containing protein [Kiritimatiellia bacterium]